MCHFRLSIGLFRGEWTHISVRMFHPADLNAVCDLPLFDFVSIASSNVRRCGLVTKLMAPRQTMQPGQGTTTFFEGDFNATVVVVIVCSTLALYNAIELVFLILITFRRHSGLYFYSILIASIGVVPYTFGYLIVYFQLCDQLAGLIISTVGWPAMVSGQSLVLFSRLGLLLIPEYPKVHRSVLWMIITDGIVFHISTTVAFFGAFEFQQNDNFVLAYRYIEKIQMTGFTIQEFILSGIYIWRALDVLKTSAMAALSHKNRKKRVMIELLSINIWIIFMDVALLVVEYQNRHVIEQCLKGVVYSIKLKLEFAILNKLVTMADSNSRRTEQHGDDFITVCTTEGTISRRPTVESRSFSTKAGKAEDISHIERAHSATSTSAREMRSIT